jgi:hypothetical protein
VVLGLSFASMGLLGELSGASIALPPLAIAMFRATPKPKNLSPSPRRTADRVRQRGPQAVQVAVPVDGRNEDVGSG